MKGKMTMLQKAEIWHLLNTELEGIDLDVESGMITDKPDPDVLVEEIAKILKGEGK